VRAARVSTATLDNLIVGYQSEAKRQAEREHARYTDLLSHHLGHSNFEVTNIACATRGIAGHVFASADGRDVRKGLGRRTCLFCECDDFDGL
jgi:hypothetical protein